MIGREEQKQAMQEALILKHSSFVAITGRRRVGKTFLIREVYKNQMCFSVTGIQNASTQIQINNFLQQIKIFSNNDLVFGKITTWQDVFIMFRQFLNQLPKNKKQVIFMDELPWMSTSKSNFLQLLAHVWNDYLSAENHFVLVVCGSATSWITQKIINDNGGFHNRVTLPLHLKPFTLGETKQFLLSKQISYTNTGIAQIYMIMGGVPFYLEQIKKGESPTKAIERICFSATGVLKNEYANLYKALFTTHHNHEALVAALAMAQTGLTRDKLIEKSKVASGGPFTRAMNDLIISDFVLESRPFGKQKRGSVYRLADEFSIFYHRFMKINQNKESAIWPIIANTQSYKIWQGYAFENLCLKHLPQIKQALGIQNVYTESSNFYSQNTTAGLQIDLVIDRKDNAINLCECKFYESNFEITKNYADTVRSRKALFIAQTNTKKMIINTFISNHSLIINQHSSDVVDVFIEVGQLM
jgi:uncharacterized protein